MIVNSTNTGWEVFYQRAHALLAAQLAAQWRVSERPLRWVETLAAIAQHDDGGREWEGENHLTDAGAPLDFRQGSFSLVQPLEVTTNAQYQGRWVALLTSMHMSFLYEPFRETEEGAAEFLDQQREHQQRWRDELGLKKGEAEAGYALLRFCDQLSLMLCMRQTPLGGREAEIDHGPDGTRYMLAEYGDGCTIRPWPFEVDSFTVRAEATYLDQLAFDSDKALQAALKAGRIETLEWTFVRAENRRA